MRWGGTCLDITNPKTQEYVRSVAHRIARDWGYRYFKLDGLWTGMATGMSSMSTPVSRRTGSARQRCTIPRRRMSRPIGTASNSSAKAAGDDVFFLGCNVAQNMRTLGASFGLLDAMRIGPDNGRKWSQICRGPFSGSNLYFLHGRVWYNDPDPIYVTDSVPIEQARALVSWVALTGQLNASSEDYKALSPERIHLLQRSMPAHGLKPRPVDLFEEKIARIWLLTDDRREPRRDVVGLFNWDEKEQAHISCSAERIGLPDAERYVGFDYWADEFIGPFGGLAGERPAAGKLPHPGYSAGVRAAAGHRYVAAHRPGHPRSPRREMGRQHADAQRHQPRGRQRSLRTTDRCNRAKWLMALRRSGRVDGRYSCRRHDLGCRTGGLESPGPDRFAREPGYSLEHSFCSDAVRSAAIERRASHDAGKSRWRSPNFESYARDAAFHPCRHWEGILDRVEDRVLVTPSRPDGQNKAGRMSYEMKAIREDDYLHVIVTGDNTPEDVVGYLQRIPGICADHGVFKVLIEENLEGPFAWRGGYF